MTGNVGIFDRLVRLAIAAVLIYLGLVTFASSSLGIGLDFLGLIAAFTGLFGFCGLYRLLGISTRKADHHPQA